MTMPSRPPGLPHRIGHSCSPRRAVLRLLLSMALLLGGPVTASANWAGLGLDGKGGLQMSGGPAATPQWHRTLSRRGEAMPDHWTAMLAALAREPRAMQIRAVNYLVNQIRYREDRDAWGRADYWATPREFFERGGDCEDFAIAKYFALRALGLPDSQLFVMVLRDQVNRVNHAVLLVEQPGGILVLDNRSDLIVPWRVYSGHKPIFWVNESSVWFRPPTN